MTSGYVVYVEAQLDYLGARFPDYDFWHVQGIVPRFDSWCWKPRGEPYGPASQNRGSPQEVAAAILGTRKKPARPRKPRKPPARRRPALTTEER